MRKEDLKAGYVLDLGKEGLAAVQPYGSGDLCISGANVWFPLDCFNEELRYFDTEVNKVYGFSSPMKAKDLDIEGRTLLWARRTKRELTIEEIEKQLGYEVALVKKAGDENEDKTYKNLFDLLHL